MVKYFIQSIEASDLGDKSIEWEINYSADNDLELAEILIDAINNDDIDTVNRFYRVVELGDNPRVIMGQE